MSSAARERLAPTTIVAVGALLAMPIVGLVAVPVYARSGPELWGFPFFYWYQFAWLFLASALTAASHVIITRVRRRAADDEVDR